MTNQTTSPYRLGSIDQFRGLAILLMVLSNYSAGIQWMPFWLRHAKDVGLTVNDLVAPLFIFAIGLTYGMSFQRRRMRDGGWKTFQHFFTRWLAILGMGTLMSAAEIATYPGAPPINWGVLQAIGVAGLVALPFMRLSPAWRAIAGVLLLGIYQVLLDRFWLSQMLAAPHGGFYGALGWSGMLLISTALADLFHRTKEKPLPYLLASTLTLVTGIALSLLVVVSKNRVSASYVIISTGVSALAFAFFHWLEDMRGVRLPLLTTWGKNPFLLYLLHYALIGIFFLPGIPALYSQASPLLTLAEAVFLVGALSWMAIRLEKRGWLLTV